MLASQARDASPILASRTLRQAQCKQNQLNKSEKKFLRRCQGEREEEGVVADSSLSTMMATLSPTSATFSFFFISNFIPSVVLSRANESVKNFSLSVRVCTSPCIRTKAFSALSFFL